MNSKFLLLLIPLWFQSTSLSANAKNTLPPIIYSKLGSQIPTQGLTYSDFQDIRVMDKESLWFIRKGNLQIEAVLEKNNLKKVSFKKFLENEVIESLFIYNKERNELENRGLQRRTLQSYAYTVFPNSTSTSQLCSLKADLDTQIADTKRIFDNSILEKNIESSIVDSSCSKVLTPQDYKSLISSHKNLFKVANRNLENNISKCLNDEGLKNKFDASPDREGQFEFLKTKSSLETANFLFQPEGQKNIIKCEEKGTSPSAAHQIENGTIVISKDKLKAPNFTDILFHEYLHRWGVKDEKSVQIIAEHCMQDFFVNNTNTIPVGALLAANRAEAADTNTDMDLNKDEALNQQFPGMNSNQKPATPDNKNKPQAQIKESPTAQPEPKTSFKSSSNFELPKDRASNGSVHSNNAEIKIPQQTEFSKSFENPHQPEIKKVQTAFWSAKPLIEAGKKATERVENENLKPSPLASGPRVEKEQIQAENPTALKAPDIEKKSAAANNQKPTPKSLEVQTSPNDLVHTSPLSIDKENMPKTIQHTRTPANSVAAPESLVSIISKSSYQKISSSLQDVQFQKSLEKEKISIINTSGQLFGATNGKVVFIDLGGRFVRQK